VDEVNLTFLEAVKLPDSRHLTRTIQQQITEQSFSCWSAVQHYE